VAWLLLQILQVIVAVMRMLWRGLPSIDLEDVGVWVLGFAAVTGIGFLIYLPVENWVAEQRRRKGMYERLRRGSAGGSVDDPLAVEIALTSAPSTGPSGGATSEAGQDAPPVAYPQSAAHPIRWCHTCWKVIKQGTLSARCPRCGLPYHVSCLGRPALCTGCRFTFQVIEDRGPRRAVAEAAVGVCPYCQTPVAAGAKIINCPACGTPHHAECWEENGGCTVYGCRYEPAG